MSNRVYNFGAGPAVIPESVLQQAQTEMLNWQNMGVSVLEISHRHKKFVERVATLKQKFIDILNVPEDFEVLFFMGPTRAQFSAIPYNLSSRQQTVGHIDSGIWSHMALAESEKYHDKVISVSSRDQSYQTLPELEKTDWRNVGYVHYCENETVNGIEYPANYQFPSFPRVVDMTSNFLSRPIDISKFDLIYAGAQKNFGPAGLVVIIIKKDLIGKARKDTPEVFNYQTQQKNDSLYYTPCNFSLYMAEMVLDWVKDSGGLEEMSRLADLRSQKLYQFIDNSAFYRNEVDLRYRSRMNVPFKLADETRNDEFVSEAEAAGLFALKGHRVVGGMRASIYNAMPEKGVDTLLDFMSAFEKKQ